MVPHLPTAQPSVADAIATDASQLAPGLAYSRQAPSV